MEIRDIRPLGALHFEHEGKRVGTLWFDGSLRFEGDAEGSAIAFFQYLKPLVDEYLRHLRLHSGHVLPGQDVSQPGQQLIPQPLR